MILPAILLALTADLEILSVTPAKSEVRTDETFSFAVRVRNHGPDAAESVRVLAGTNASGLLRSITAPPEWTCDEQGPRFGYGFACTTPSLAAGEERELVVTVAAPQPSAMTYRVGGSVSSKTADPKRDGNRREANLALLVSPATAELSMSARAPDDAERVTFDVRNDGPADARDVLVVLERAALASGDGWTCRPSPTGVACTRPLLRAGQTSALAARGAAAAKIEARVRAELIHDATPLDNAAKVQ